MKSCPNSSRGEGTAHGAKVCWYAQNVLSASSSWEEKSPGAVEVGCAYDMALLIFLALIRRRNYVKSCKLVNIRLEQSMSRGGHRPPRMPNGITEKLARDRRRNIQQARISASRPRRTKSACPHGVLDTLGVFHHHRCLPHRLERTPRQRITHGRRGT